MAASAHPCAFRSGAIKPCRKVAAYRPGETGDRALDTRQQRLRAVAVATASKASHESTVILPGHCNRPAPASVAESLRHVFLAGAAAQGVRSKMEDTHFTALLHPRQGVQSVQGGISVAQQTAAAAAAVFDGHAGSSTAEQAARHTPHMLHAALTGQYRGSSKGAKESCPSALPPSCALAASLQCFDTWWGRQHGDDRSGSTAVMGVIAGEQLYVANTGDSVALLARAGSSHRLSVDHRADNAAELMRVITAGGDVDYDKHGTLRVYRPNDHFRLNGAMFTRSLGDFHFKSPVPLLTSAPHVTQRQLSPADQLVLLVSDGVSDVIPDDDVMSLALRALDKARDYTDDGQQIAQAAATEVMCAALCSGSTDNVTAVAMLLDWS